MSQEGEGAREEIHAALADLRSGPRELVELYNDYAVPYQVSHRDSWAKAEAGACGHRRRGWVGRQGARGVERRSSCAPFFATLPTCT